MFMYGQKHWKRIIGSMMHPRIGLFLETICHEDHKMGSSSKIVFGCPTREIYYVAIKMSKFLLKTVNHPSDK